MGNILYHGRLQPPHSGHISLIRWSLNEKGFDNCIVSLDKPINYNDDNLFTFHERKMALVSNLIKENDSVIIIGHERKNNPFKTLINIEKNVNNLGLNYENILQGPNPKDCIKLFWKFRDKDLVTPEKRFFNISGSKCRSFINHQEGDLL